MDLVEVKCSFVNNGCNWTSTLKYLQVRYLLCCIIILCLPPWWCYFDILTWIISLFHDHHLDITVVCWPSWHYRYARHVDDNYYSMLTSLTILLFFAHHLDDISIICLPPCQYYYSMYTSLMINHSVLTVRAISLFYVQILILTILPYSAYHLDVIAILCLPPRLQF